MKSVPHAVASGFSSAGAFLVLVVALALSVTVQNWLDAENRIPIIPEDTLYVRSGEILKRASLGFTGLTADAYCPPTRNRKPRAATRLRSSTADATTPAQSSVIPTDVLEEPWSPTLPEVASAIGTPWCSASNAAATSSRSRRRISAE